YVYCIAIPRDLPSSPPRRSSDLTLASLRKGFVRETLGLVSTIAGLVLAFWFYGIVAGMLEQFLSSRRLANLLGFLIVFVAVHLRSEEHTSELQSRENLVCRLLLE